MQPHPKSDTVITPDLYLAAYLRTLQIDPIKLTNENGRTFFTYAKNKNLEEAMRTYVSDGKLSLPIREFIKAIRDIKYLIYHPTEFNY